MNGKHQFGGGGMEKSHNGHIEEVRRFLKRVFRARRVNHLTDIDTEFDFDHDGILRRVTVAQTFFDSVTRGDIAVVLEGWKLAEKVVTAQGKTVYVGEDGLSTLE